MGDGGWWGDSISTYVADEKKIHACLVCLEKKNRKKKKKNRNEMNELRLTRVGMGVPGWFN